jgi:hypothetical protein
MDDDWPATLGDLDGISITASQGFLALGKFFQGYFDRTQGTGDLPTLLSDVKIIRDKGSSDPAALGDWARAVREVLADTPNA